MLCILSFLLISAVYPEGVRKKPYFKGGSKKDKSFAVITTYYKAGYTVITQMKDKKTMKEIKYELGKYELCI